MADVYQLRVEGHLDEHWSTWLGDDLTLTHESDGTTSRLADVAYRRRGRTVLAWLAGLLKPRANRITNIAVSVLYAVTIVGSCIGETWLYYLLGSAVEVVLLLAIARTAWKWPRQHVAS